MWRPLAIAATAVLALSGCGKGAPSRPACPPGKLCLHVGNTAEPGTLDPAKITGNWENNIAGDLFEGLMAEAVDGKVIPGMALSYTTSPDGLVWTFKLRDALWSDGQPVTADDFVFALRRGQDPATASEYSYLLNVIEGAQAINEGKAKPDTLGVRALDPKTLEIRLTHPAPYLPGLLTHTMTFPVPAHLIRKVGDAWIQPKNFVSNGPYTLAGWTIGDRIRLVKNPRYYEASKVCLDEVGYYPISEVVSAERRVLRGELDMNNNIQANRVGYLRSRPEAAPYVHTHTSLVNAYLAFNGHNPKFKDVRVRRAIAMAIDRDFIVGKLLRAGQAPAYGFLPPGIANYPNPAKVYWADWSFERRQAEAKRLLGELGYSPANPLKVELTHRGLDQGFMLPAIQADLKAVGVEMSLIGAESQVAYAAYRNRDFEMADAGWVADFDDPVNFLELARGSTGAQNYGDYANPAYDALLAQADVEPDAAKRSALLARAEKLLIDDAPITTIYFDTSRNIVNPDVTGFVANINDVHRKRWMCFKDPEKYRTPAR